MVLLLPTVPVRLLLAVWATVAVAVVNTLAVWGCDLDAPLPPWRRRIVKISSKSFCRVFIGCFGFWRPRIVGMENWKEGQRMGAIGIFNHVSYLDAFVMTWSLCAAGLTMNFSKNLPVLGYAVQALQNLYLPKEGDKSAQQASMVERIRQRARNAGLPTLVVAPEGTLSDGRCLLMFKRGAFVAGVPVVPILLKYKLTPHNPAWTVFTPAWHVLRLLCQFENRVEVEVLPPYQPSQQELQDPALYAANVRRLMADKLGVRLVDQDRSHYLALVNAGVNVSLDGRSVTAPPGLVAANGMFDIAPYMPGVFKPQARPSSSSSRSAVVKKGV